MSHGTVPRTSWFVVAARFGIWTILSLIALLRTGLRQRKINRERNRIMSQDEMTALIRSFAIRSFTNDEDGVSVIYIENRDADGQYVYKARRACRDGYPAYVAAANEARRLGAEITYFNRIGRNDPTSAGTRWLSVDEARELLFSGSIDAFYCGNRDPFPDEPAAGDPTGIKLIDFGWVRHLYVESELASTMVPIARSVPSPASCGYYLIMTDPLPLWRPPLTARNRPTRSAQPVRNGEAAPNRGWVA